MSLLYRISSLHNQIARRLGLVPANGIVLKDQQALKEGNATRHLAPSLDPHKWTILVLLKLNLLLLQFPQPGEKGLLWNQAHADRQGVDKHTNGCLHTWEVSGTPGNGRPEDEIVLPTIAAEEQ